MRPASTDIFMSLDKQLHPSCPLCSNLSTIPFHHDATRNYLHCSICDLIFAHPDHYLTRAEEFSRYEYHNNDLEDPGYRSFLTKLFAPMNNRISPKSSGLDFGSGPGPLLKIMFEEQGHSMSIYDTFYAPESIVFNQSYDFITTSETVEHLQRPLDELDQLWACLKAGGLLGIMTGIIYEHIEFSTWHYIRDDTHVVFFSPRTFKWLAQHWGAELEFSGENVVLFKKK